MQLSQKQKTFSRFVFGFLKSTLNFEHFQTKDNPLAHLFPELQAPLDKLDQYLISPA